MEQLAPTGKPVPCTLSEYLYPQWFQLKATAAEDRRTILPVQLEGPHTLQADNLDLDKWIAQWVSEEGEGTKKGDLEATAKIRRWLEQRGTEGRIAPEAANSLE